MIADGRARFVYRHMAFLGEESVQAAAASECAKDQGRFWDYYDRLQTAQNGRNQGAFSKENLKWFGGELGLQATPFNACVDTDHYVGRVRSETELGRQRGVNSTPTIFVNGQQLERGATLAQILERVNLVAPVTPRP